MRDFFAHTYDLLAKGGAALAGFLYGTMKGEGRSALFLVILMTADYISGIVAAAMGKSPNSDHGRLSSAAGGKGLLKKAVILLVVGLAVALDWFMGNGNQMFQTAVIWFYISNETLSLLENLARCGVPIPRKLRAMLESLREKEEEEKQTPPQNG
ncbi:MAG: phage holin family protein [Eubacteriales bacterium]|nr:phage holin family protein [Eubacteriales bacterium]